MNKANEAGPHPQSMEAKMQDATAISPIKGRMHNVQRQLNAMESLLCELQEKISPTLGPPQEVPVDADGMAMEKAAAEERCGINVDLDEFESQLIGFNSRVRDLMDRCHI